MSEPQKTFYLTTPIYYVNARPHIGHAYTTIVADVLARRHRLLGDDTFFLTGTDEHGQKIERSASAAGIPPQQFADQVSQQFRDLWDRMGLTYTEYIRTTDPAHKAGVQHLFTQLWDKGFIYLDKYTGSYCVSDEAFVDAPVGTPCPDCGRLLEEVTEENFFFKLSEFQKPLIEAILSDKLKVEPTSAKNEVLRFLTGNIVEVASKFAMDEGHEDVSDPIGVIAALRAGSLAEVAVTTGSGLSASLVYVPGALKDLSISRSSFTWGIPVPEAVQRAAGATQPHVIYVWLDALANYMTALGYPDGPNFEKFWPADLHLVGKEITRFHCVYWPAFLMAADIATPKRITANGWLLFDNSKMSKSKGNVVRTETILEGFGRLCPPVPVAAATAVGGPASPVKGTESALAAEVRPPTPQERDLFASDVLRYFLLREIPFGQDGSFSFEAMVTRYNADLANGYGNLVSRTLNMVEQYFKAVPPYEAPVGSQGWDRNQWLEYLYEISLTKVFWSEEGDKNGETAGPTVMDIFNQASALHSFLDINNSVVIVAVLARIQALIAMTDRYLSINAPWKLAKEETTEAQRRLHEVLYAAAESVRIITTFLYPILPFSTGAVWQQLGLGDIEADAKAGKLKNLAWGGLQPGTELGPLAPIFPRAPKELTEIMSEIENPTPTAEAASTHPAAAPRSADANTPAATLPVAGSTATTTHNGPTPSHTEVPASGIFAAASTPPAEAPAAETSPEITIDDFVKVELRVAEIKLAERIPKADKLLRLEVDLGPLGQRQILSGIAEHYAPEDLIGRRIIVITNLAPRKMRGLESHGMLLAASEEGGKPYLATVPEGVPVGTRLK